MNKKFVIDGTNVCWWYANIRKDQLSIAPLLTVLIALLENGDDFYCVFDASTVHDLKKQGKEIEKAFIDASPEKYPGRFFIVTGSTRADGAVLHHADHYGDRIITNDIFKDYRDKYPWLKDPHTDRLIQGNLQPSGILTMDKLSYGRLELIDDLDAATSRFDHLIRFPPKADQQVGEDEQPAGRFQEARSAGERIQDDEDENEQTLIRKVRNEINRFLEPYDTERVPFKGSSWDVAVKGLRVFFDRNNICTHCYYISAIYDDRCLACNKGRMTDYPEEIWDIVEKYAPLPDEDDPPPDEDAFMPDDKIRWIDKKAGRFEQIFRSNLNKANLGKLIWVLSGIFLIMLFSMKVSDLLSKRALQKELSAATIELGHHTSQLQKTEEKLREAKKEQGLLKTVFNDSEKVDKLEKERKRLRELKAQMEDKVEKLRERIRAPD